MKNGGLKIAVFAVVLVAAIALSFTPLMKNLHLGLDLQGGAEVVLQAVPEEGKSITDEDMTQLQEVIRNRVDNLGVSEPIIQLEGDDRIIVQLAGVDNPDEAISLIGQTAKLEFIDPEGNVVVSGSDLADASGQSDGVSSDSGVISLTFSEEGAKKFAEATQKYVGQNINIYLDGNLLISATVNEPILDGKAQISGSYTLEDAIAQAAILKGGALPVDVDIMSKRTVGPSLGSDSLTASLYAGLLGLLLLFIYMIIYYRLPGAIAVLSLLTYTLLLFWAEVLLGVTLTLPSIAGFVLSIGMAVDANIIIYERLREELRAGKTLRAAIRAGFKRALWTILDSNITTLLAGAVLFKFGTGSVQGFAVTLSIGIIISMFSALFITKYLLQWSSDINACKIRPRLYVNLAKGGQNND
ncbi:MAG: protein translocase subunit SecD [Bacillota bacterium]